MITEEQWQEAKLNFDKVMQIYKDHVGALGVNTELALLITFAPLLRRFNSGERTQELYDAMMAVE